MKNLIKYILFISVCTGIISCENFLDPVDENRLDFDYVSTNPGAAEGMLLQGYARLVNQYSFTEAATDDAVNNKLTNTFKRMALGELSAQFNPTSRWNNYENVLWINKFLKVIDAGKMVWSTDKEINEMFYLRLKGEALALRALHHFYILQAHAGKGASGELLGVPYIKEFIESNGNFSTPRLSFEETVNQIMADYDQALNLLPTDYSDIQVNINPIYQPYDFNKYKVVNGSKINLRISGRIVKGLKARLALFAASPSFFNGKGYYEMAANYSSELLNDKGGIAGLSTSGLEYYTSTAGQISDEMLWRGSQQTANSTIEKRMFPPSANGTGEICPTQNFVDAFPMQNGFPIAQSSTYNPQNPYANRDPRLAKFVVLNGTVFGGKIIKSAVGGGIDRLDSIPEFSTKTGYYLKKLLRPDVLLNSDNTSINQIHCDVYFRNTELFLIFAESANEIGGPDHQINGMTPRSVIAAIRKRAGLAQPDNYLASINTKEGMRVLIRNERRLELSFEGHRFWDLRRWGLPLNETAKGAFINKNVFDLNVAVEARIYPAFATYLPIPNDEIIKFPVLIQNFGWSN